MLPGRVLGHLASGGTASTLPGANQLWMLFGFDLFAALGATGIECLEVHPQAIVRALGAGGTHKTKDGAVLAQLTAASIYTRWPERPSLPDLEYIGSGSLHDRLDAYLSAWVASLGVNGRRPLGTPPHDVIWVPLLTVGPTPTE